LVQLGRCHKQVRSGNYGFDGTTTALGDCQASRGIGQWRSRKDHDTCDYVDGPGRHHVDGPGRHHVDGPGLHGNFDSECLSEHRCSRLLDECGRIEVGQQRSGGQRCDGNKIGLAL
jgi:hypothetical protein